jgi:hypothetical protein
MRVQSSGTVTWFVAFSWPRKWSRVTDMSWDEVHSRVRQELFKRLDLALYRVGIEPSAPSLRPRLATRPKFFFGNDDTGAHRAALLRTHLPREAEAIIAEADEICTHEFRLLGYQKVNYGREIDWHAAHGKHCPLDPWFKINFLDFQTVGDHKVIWELNRHQHLVTLAKAWLLTDNAAYPNEIVNQWASWRKANPYPLGINWASALEVAFRSLSWLWVRNLLTDCPSLPTGFDNDVLGALQSHGRYIELYLSNYFSPNTHLIGEAVALFFIGTLCPEIAAAKRWRNRGWSIILHESERQVRPDGVYFEQALYYHVYALDLFLHARILASENGIAIPERFDNVLKKMLHVIQALSEIGPIEGFGDDDGGRIFNPRRNRVEYMTDPLAVGAILYHQNKAHADLTEESIWLFGDKATETFGKPSSDPDTASKAFQSGGIYLINDWHPHRQQLMIDAGPQGTGSSGHGHADALSIRFSVDGQRFLIDPGTYCYVSGGTERNWFRGTGAHNTLRVDNLDQAVPEGPFAWSSIPNVTAETWLKGRTFDLFIGSHDGYGRLPQPVLHRRFVFHVKGGFSFVRDLAEGYGRHLLESFWHFAPEVVVTEERGIVLAASSVDNARGERASVGLLIDPSSAWTTEIAEGFVSSVYGAKQIDSVLRASANVALPEDCGVLLLPGIQASDIGTFATLGEGSVREVRGYRYQTPQTTEVLFFAQGDHSWTCGPWTSNSKLLYCKLENGRFTHVIMVCGSFAEWQGKRFVSHALLTESFEWLSREGSTKGLSSDGGVTEESVIADFEVLDSIS